MRKLNLLVAGLFVAAGVSTGAQAAVIEVRVADDDRLFDYEAVSDGTNPSQGTGNDLRIGTTVASATAPRLASTILPFALPVIPAGQEIIGATLTVQVTAQASSNDPRADQFVDLYGLPFDDAEAGVDITNARHFSGASDMTEGVSKLQDNFLTPTIGATDAQLAVTSIDISAYLISLYNGTADAGDFAVFRLSDDNPDGSVVRRYRIRSAGGTSTANPEEDKPLLTITTGPVVPEPATFGLMAVVSLGLLARRRRLA